jgi:hypothetical protein
VGSLNTAAWRAKFCDRPDGGEGSAKGMDRSPFDQKKEGRYGEKVDLGGFQEVN